MALQFPSNRNDYYGTLRFTPEETEGNEQIELYLPASLQVGDKVEYENVGLGAGFGTLMNGGFNFTNEDGTNKTYDQFSLSDLTEIGKVLSGKAISSFSDVAGAAVREGTRTAPNPNTRAIFKQVNLRSFQFTFKFIPNNEGEANTITNIIKEFRKNMYPERLQGSSLGYKFPNRYTIEGFYGEDPVGVKTEHCYLESVMTNYNPSSQGFMTNGGASYFAETDVSLTFIEGRTLDKSSIGKGY